MPNHITNIIRIKSLGESTVEDVCDSLLNDENMVDFNKIKKSPECLDGFEPHSGIIEAAKRALGLFELPSGSASDMSSITKAMGFRTAVEAMTKEIKIEDIDNIIRAMSNYKKCGFLYWYDWNTNNWENKWNAYGQSEVSIQGEDTVFQFQTAWSHPEKLIKLLSKKLPSVVFDVSYADEDIGRNCGIYTILNGDVTSNDIAPSYSDQSDSEKSKWAEFSFNICNPNDDPREYGYGKDWVYSDGAYEQWELEQSTKEPKS